MIGVFYIVLCVLCGAKLCGFFFPKLKTVTVKLGLPRFLVELPAWYLTGTLLLTWLVYLTALIFQNIKEPLAAGNGIVLSVAAVVLAVLYFLDWKKKGKRENQSETILDFFLGEGQGVGIENFSIFLYVLIAIGFVSFLMFLTFYQKDGTIYVGYSVFSDFAPHLGMIRSFSASNNFPTQYAHFAGEDIRYHFMFQFLAGNLEYLGLRLDLAFNLPSIFGMVSVYFLLFTLTVRITKSRLCGYFTAFLFTFRSSFTVFRYMAEQDKGTVLSTLLKNREFLGYTQNENWGLWNLNVYCNQRHLAFALAVMLLAILLFYPYVEGMAKRLASIEKGDRSRGKVILAQGKELFFTKTAFGIRNIKFSIGMGLMLGAIAFWNGSALVATLAMLFFMAAVSQYRLDYLIAAVLALVLYMLQSALFVEGSVVSPSYYFGFLAENRTIWGVAVFIVELTGIVLLIALFGATVLKGVKRYMLIVFLVPFVLAFTLSLTGDITVNHKWIMMSLMLVSMFAAAWLTKLWESKDWLKRVVAVVMLFVLTATGMYDLTIVVKRNENYMKFAVDDPVTNWIMENATCDDIFLTPYYSLHKVVMGGAMLYYGWPYYAWSAGYDTDTRNWNVKQMYEASSVSELYQLIEENNIRYIVVDHDCRTSSEYDVREDIIEEAYEAVFEDGSGEWAFRIFDTQKPKQ